MNIYFYAIIIAVFLYFVIKIGGEKWRSFLIFASIFWFIGLTMLIDGCRKWMDYKEIQQTYSQTTAQITDVREYEVLDNDEIDIYYSPENPKVIVSPDHVESKLSFILPTGVILCIIPFVLEITGRILLKKQKRST